jgi:hypothetical protein
MCNDKPQAEDDVKRRSRSWLCLAELSLTEQGSRDLQNALLLCCSVALRALWIQSRVQVLTSLLGI